MTQPFKSREIKSHQTRINQKTRMTSKPEDIRSKYPLKKIKKCEGVVDHNIICIIYLNIQANMSTIQSELGRGQHGILGLEMQQSHTKQSPGKNFNAWPILQNNLQLLSIHLQPNSQGISNIMRPKWTSGTKWWTQKTYRRSNSWSHSTKNDSRNSANHTSITPAAHWQRSSRTCTMIIR